MCWICYNYLLKPLYCFIKKFGYRSNGFKIALTIKATINEIMELAKEIQLFIEDWNHETIQEKVLPWMRESLSNLSIYYKVKELYNVLDTIVSVEDACLCIVLFCVVDYRFYDRTERKQIIDFQSFYNNLYANRSLNNNKNTDLFRSFSTSILRMKRNIHYDKNSKFQMISMDRTPHLLICFHCCGPGGRFEIQGQCINCKLAIYCSKECQKKDWMEHKELCSLFVKVA